MQTIRCTIMLITMLLGAASPALAADSPAAATAPAAPKKILMIGNSLTYTYGVPAIIEQLAAAAKHPVEITAHTTGGKDLTWHWTNASKPSALTAPEAIAKGGYDLVILQDGSHNLLKKEGQEAFDKIIPQYIKAIRAKNMPTLLYMAHPTAKAVNAPGLQPIIENYTKKADEFGLPCAPVALAFIKCDEKLPKLALFDLQVDRKYAQDKVATHPSPFGAYLVACTLYSAIYNQSPVGLKFHAAFDAKKEFPLEAADATAAQEVAWQVWQEYQQKRAATRPTTAPAGTKP